MEAFSDASIQGGRRKRRFTLENITLESLQTLKKNIEEKSKPSDLQNIDRSIQQIANVDQQSFPISAETLVVSSLFLPKMIDLHQSAISETNEQDPDLSDSDCSIGTDTELTFNIDKSTNPVAHTKESVTGTDATSLSAIPVDEAVPQTNYPVQAKENLSSGIDQKTDDDWVTLTEEDLNHFI